MDIQQIHYFLTIAKHQSFTKAAQELYVTQPILTRCVKSLEKELGSRLIVRSTKSFILTDAGQVLVKRGKELLQQHQDIYRHIHDAVKIGTGEIRFSCPGVLLDMYFPQIVNDYRKMHPGTRITVQECGTRTAMQDVLEGNADIGMVMLPLESVENLNVFPILEDEVHVFVRKDHPFAKMESIDIEQLKGIELITYNKSTTLHNAFLKMCFERGFTPKIVYQSMMPGFIYDMLTYGNCVGILPAPMLKQLNREELVSVPLTPKFPWKIAMITQQGRYLPCASSHFLRFTKSCIGNLPEE